MTASTLRDSRFAPRGWPSTIARPSRVLALTALAVALAGAAATQLSLSPSSSLLVGAHSPTGRASAALERHFGQEPLVVSVEADLGRTLAPANLVRLLALEGRLARVHGVQAVYGPGTFINQAIVQTERVMETELGGVARRLRGVRSERERRRILGAKADEYRDLLVRLGSVGLPALSNQAFVNTLVFGAGVEPKRRFQWLFPDGRHALVLVRPRPGLEGDAALALGRRVERLARGAGLDARVDVAGLPLLAAALERQTRSELLRLAPIALGAMLLLLLIVLRRRRARFAPLLLAAAGTTVALGLSWPLGLGLTTATVAALPVTLGLALDFAVQLQARYWREREKSLQPQPPGEKGQAPFATSLQPQSSGERGQAPFARSLRPQSPAAAAAAARRAVGPTLLLAGAAMVAGFLVLLLSPVPLLDRLGAFLALGTACSLAVVLLAGPALLCVLDRGTPRPIALALPGVARGVRPGAVAALAAFAAVGLAFSHETPLQSDLAALAPPGLAQLRDVEHLQRSLGTSGQISVAVRARDVTDPRVLGYLNRVSADVQRRDPRLRPGPNVAELVTGGQPRAPADRAEVERTLALLPSYFVDAVVSRDRRTAALTFGVPFVSVAEQARTVHTVEDALRGAPAGVQAQTAGLVAAAAHSTESLDDSRPWLLLLAAGAIALVLMAAWRDASRVLQVLTPALIAAGLSALALVVFELRLSPLGGALEPLVLAVGLEFGMLLDLGYREARAAGQPPSAAAGVSVQRIGGAVALSAATVAAGFGTLATSGLPLVAQLGRLVAFELLLCVLVALLAVPALSAWRERATRPARAGATLPLGRRYARVRP